MLAIWESYVASVFRHDTVTARQLATRHAGVARALGAVDLEMLAQASLGFATVCEGDIEPVCVSSTRRPLLPLPAR